jgi:hypothetical protein
VGEVCIANPRSQSEGDDDMLCESLPFPLTWGAVCPANPSAMSIVGSV